MEGSEDVPLPCSNCGCELVDGEETTVTVELDFEFGGKPATREEPALICPDCGEVTPL